MPSFPLSRNPLGRFGTQLLVIAVGALALRLAYVVVIADDNPNFGDGLYYHTQANLLADGHGFSEPFTWLDSRALVPTAVHPPLFSVALASGSLVGVTSFFGHKVVACLIGTATVIGVGLLGRRLAGTRAGLAAAILAALYPSLWIVDGILLPEGLFALTVTSSVLAAYWFVDSPTTGRAVVLGATIGLAALTRGEGIFLAAVLTVPLVLFRTGVASRQRIRLLVLATAATGVVILPWIVRNTVRFDEPVFLSTNSSDVLAQSNCGRTYHGELLGYWFFPCGLRGEFPEGDESARAVEAREIGIEYAREHAERLPVVIAARLGRVWDVYRPFQNVRLSQIEGRDLEVSRAGLFMYWALLPFAVGGAVVLHRRRVTLVPLLAPLVMVVIAAVTTYGNVRFRSGAEPAIVVLAAVGADRFLARAGARARDPVSARPRSGSVAGPEHS